MRARLVSLLPGVPMLNGTVCSRVCNTEEDIQNMLEEVIRLKVQPLLQLRSHHSKARPWLFAA